MISREVYDEATPLTLTPVGAYHGRQGELPRVSSLSLPSSFCLTAYRAFSFTTSPLKLILNSRITRVVPRHAFKGFSYTPLH